MVVRGSPWGMKNRQGMLNYRVILNRIEISIDFIKQVAFSKHIY